MRLGNVVDEKSSSGGEGQGDKPIGRSKSKRSSLDFKVSSYHSSGSAITTKPGKRKNRQQQQQQQQFEEEQLKQQQQIRRPYLSRARGHSGPPPRKWELADLQNMNEEELLQALYADPQLAQEAARMAEKIAAEKGTSPSAVPSGNPSRRPTTTTGRGKRGSRAAGRNGPGEYPDHMRELMDGGFPFMQWLILLVLLGAAFYQLRKMLSLPDHHTKDLYRRRPRAKGEPKNAAKKTKATTEDMASLEKVALAIDADILSSENVKGKAANKKAIAAASKKQKAKKEKGNTKNNNPVTATTKTNQQKQEDTTDDNSVGSDDGDFPAPRAAAAVKVAPPVRVPATAPLPTLSASIANADDGNGWQTVTKTTRGAVEPTLEGGKSSGQNVEKSAASPPVESKENTPPTATAALNGKNDATAAKTKKKQKKGKGKGLDNNTANAASNASKEGVEDDAALAQELQREEDKMAQGKNNKNNTSDGDNTWEEVSTRKRKGAKPDAATN